MDVGTLCLFDPVDDCSINIMNEREETFNTSSEHARGALPIPGIAGAARLGRGELPRNDLAEDHRA